MDDYKRQMYMSVLQEFKEAERRLKENPRKSVIIGNARYVCWSLAGVVYREAAGNR